MAGLVTGLAGGEFVDSSQPEGEAVTSTLPKADLSTSLYKYIPTKYYQAKTSGFLTGPASGTPLEIAVAYLKTNAADFGLTTEDINHLVVKSQNTSSSSGATSIYFRQTYNGLDIANADVQVSVAKNGEIISVGSTAVGKLAYPSQEQSLTPGIANTEAFKRFGQQAGLALTSTPQLLSPPQGRNQRTVLSGAGGTADNVTAELQYVATPNGLQLAWKMVVLTADRRNWYDAYSSASDGSALYVANWIQDATYDVYALPNESPAEGNRTLVTDPHSPNASPFGWHDVNGQVGPDFLDTRGNNVWAQADILGLAATSGQQIPATRPTGGSTLTFDYPVNLFGQPSTYTNASVVNLFYTANMAHDIFYNYGFDEASGNFQQMNYSGLGKGGDAVLALAQSGGALGFNTGGPRMGTPPDGFRPMLVMTEVNVDISALFAGLTALPLYSPARDASFENNVIIHEYGHGVTNRLVGGPTNVNALNAIQSLAMGEGWSDFFGFWATLRSTDNPNGSYASGDYLAGPNPLFPGKGIRRFPYSFDTSINPLTFGDFNGAGGATCATNASNCESHNAGEIWAQILLDMNWLMVDKYGFSSDVFSGTGGNNLAMRLVVEALKLTPVNPTFTNARDAILQADLILNRGVNHDVIWEAFARRGMGYSADSDTSDLGVSIGFGGPVFVDSPNAIDVREGFDMPPNRNHVQGRVFADVNGNGVFDLTESELAGVTVYIDVDNDGNFDPLEPSQVTTSNGSYDFELFVGGQFRINQLVPAGTQQTTPSGIGGQTVVVAAGQTVTGVNFGVRTGGVLGGGLVYNDLDGDGRRDEDEPGLAGVYVYADYDGDKRMDLGEPQTVTNSDGNYSLNLDRIGSYYVRQVVPSGYTQTFPTRGDGFLLTVANGTLNANFEFGDTVSEDWGDAPNSYRTLSASAGAVHGYLPGFFLGTSVDMEADGVPTDGATGDDATPTDLDDENGVTFSSAMFPGSTTNITVAVNLKDRITETVNGKTKTTVLQDNSAGRLYGWIDFNRDGDFDDSGETVFSDLLLLEGAHNLSFKVPRAATPGVTYARFRYGYEHNLGPSGRSIAGEVEDYQVRILTDTPDAIDDVFTVNAGSTANQLTVLANDIASSNGELVIDRVSTSTKATIVIAPDGKSLRYSPKSGQLGADSFTYTVRDPAGVTDTARVTVTILAANAAPIAVDDSVDVNENSANNIIAVLANDLAGTNAPIGIVSFDSPSNGTLELDNRNTTDPADDVFRYTPNVGFAGTDRFRYIIEDSDVQQSTATVTVHVKPGDLSDDIVEYRLEVTDINNRPIQAIGVGETFKLRAYVEDLRTDDTVNDGVDRLGVGAAYFDALYSYNLISLSGSPIFSGPYTNVTSGSLAVPGLIDEVGALQSSISDPVGPGEKLLFEINAIATGVGTATFVGDPADQTADNSGASRDHDTILFEPPQNAVTVRQIRFTNTSLQIVGSGGRPSATDNTFTVPANVVDTPLTVLANDIDLNNPPLTISAVGTASGTTFTTANGSRVAISTDGQLLLYTPRNGFNGTEQFTYTVRNAVGLTSSATVTMQVGTPTKELSVRLVATDMAGNALTGPVTLGDDFQVRVYVQDTRTNPPDRNRMGVFSAYLDLLYDNGLVSTIGDLTAEFGFRMSFGPEYNQNGKSASNSLPYVINELGAFQTSFGPLGPSEQLLAAVTFNADRAGTANFVADPADVSPQHDVLLFEPDDSSVSLSRISFRTTSVVIVNPTTGGEFTNPVNAFDVNADNSVTPADALIVINAVNTTGSVLLRSNGNGEGEPSRAYVDVNKDGYLSPQDALMVINKLSRGTGSGAEGEFVLVVPLAQPVTNSSPEIRSAPYTRDRSLMPAMIGELPQPMEIEVHTINDIAVRATDDTANDLSEVFGSDDIDWWLQ